MAMNSHTTYRSAGEERGGTDETRRQGNAKT